MIFPNSCLLTVTTECVTVLNDGDGVRIELLHCEARTTLINFGDIAGGFYPFKTNPPKEIMARSTREWPAEGASHDQPQHAGVFCLELRY